MVACHQSSPHLTSSHNTSIIIINNNKITNDYYYISHPLDGGLPPVFAPLDLHLGPLHQPVRRLPRKMIRCNYNYIITFECNYNYIIVTYVLGPLDQPVRRLFRKIII